MAEFFSVPLKPADLLADTNHLTAEEFGAHMRLLLTVWLKDGRLRDDDAELTRIAGVSRRRWRNMRERVMRPFTTIHGEISHKLITETLDTLRETRRQKILAAKARWFPNTHAGALRMQSSRNAIKTKKDKALLADSLQQAAAPKGAIDESERDKAAAPIASAELVAIIAKKAMQ